MRRRFFSTQYSRKRGHANLFDDAPTLDELAAERKRAGEKAKSAGAKEPPASPLQVQPWAG